MKWIFTILLLTVSAFAQSQYGADYILLRAVTTDGNSNLNFGNFPRSGFAPAASPIGAVSLYFDSAAACIKASINGGAYACLGGGGSGTVTNTGGALTLNAVMLGAGGNDSKVDTALSTDAAGSITDTQGTITTSKPLTSHTVTWNAAGVAFTNWLSNITCTASAANSIALGLGVAGTTWQFKYLTANCGGPQLLAPTGAVTAPSYSFNGLNMGFYNGSSQVTYSDGANAQFTFATANFRMGKTGVFGWSNTNNNALNAFELTLSDSAAGVLQVGTTAANSAGVLVAAAYRGGGAAATLTGTGACATFSGQVGGSSTGQAACASATGAATLTITPGTTAPNGWVCYVQDETTRANLLQQTSHTTTACTLTSTNVNQNDVFVFSAFQY